MICYFILLCPKTEKNKAYCFMGKNGLTPYPWPFVHEYKNDACCLFDEKTKSHYVVHNGKKLFFPEKMSISQIKEIYLSLIIEQDLRSPHRYLKGNYEELTDRVLLDIGSAEGIFSLDAIEYVKHVYLFECEPHWINALNTTFEPWKEKVTIIPKYVTDKDSDTEVKIDSCRHFWSESSLFIKMDIEGAELSALKGAYEVLTGGTDVKMAICTYHRPQDAVEISSCLSSLNYSFSYTDGYLFFDWHLNKAIVRAQNKE